MSRTFKKVLVANRGEIAVRIIRAAQCQTFAVKIEIVAGEAIIAGEVNDRIIDRVKDDLTVFAHIDLRIVKRDLADIALKADRQRAVAGLVDARVVLAFDAKPRRRDVRLIIRRAHADREQADHRRDKNRQNP